MDIKDFEKKYGKGFDVEVGIKLQGPHTSELTKTSHAHVYEIMGRDFESRYFEIWQPLDSESYNDKEVISYYDGKINSDGRCVFLREVKPCVTSQGKVSMARCEYPTILTKCGMYTCERCENVRAVVEDQFLIVEDTIKRVGKVKNIVDGETLFHSHAHCDPTISYNPKKAEFSMAGYDYHIDTISLESVLTEVKKREKVSKALSDYGLTLSEAKTVSGIVKSYMSKDSQAE